MSTNTLSPLKRTITGVQFMFVAFGSTVLVPIPVGFDPAIALLAAGLGTLLFHLVAGGKVPIYLGSSFAFIAPIIKATELYGMPGMFCGLAAVGSPCTDEGEELPLHGTISNTPSERYCVEETDEKIIIKATE